MNQPAAPKALFDRGSEVALPHWRDADTATWTPLRAALRDAPHADKAQRAGRPPQAQAGYEDGFRQGRQAAQEGRDALLMSYQNSIADLVACRASLVKQSQDDLVRLALHVAGQILLTDVEARHDFTARMVQHALQLLAAADSIALHIAPTDLAAVLARRPDLKNLSQVQLIADPTVALGGVIAQCTLGRVDATLERRLAEMGAMLVGHEAPRPPANVENEAGEAAEPTENGAPR